ncbi:hypothetical protein [uncultured Croceitalea sp.]|uniref:hypothetical protein n=1 Tax=uncultured Croceitalea sp. TaxID=1798908 RepID=UPI0033062D18
MQIFLSFSQTEDIEPNFGIRLTDIEVELPNEYNYVTHMQLQILSKSKSKHYYNNNNEGKYDDDFENVRQAKITWKKKEGANNKYETIIPPLKPNRFYRLAVSYYSSESVVALFLMMHKEKNADWYSNQKEWMKLLNRISDRNEPFSITYDPTIIELYGFQYRIKDTDLSILDIKESQYIKGIKDEKIIKQKKEELKKKKENIIVELDKAAKIEFKVLNFDENKSRYTNKDLIDFSKWIQSKSDFNEDDIIAFSGNFVNSPDYINIYEFYEKYLFGPLNDNSYKLGELLDVIKNAVNEEKLNHYNKKTGLLPNYLIEWVEEDLIKTTVLSTYSNSFETSYKLSLVPDFGYVAYLNNNDNTPQGGNLFLGVNISLSPSNKNAPLQISDLTTKQRLSIHTGVTIGSIAQDNVRDDFFGDYSLLLGGSYKVLTQGTRINFGGLLYNKIDAINGSKSLAIQPYLGLSIDLEIRQWLQTLFPKLKI